MARITKHGSSATMKSAKADRKAVGDKKKISSGRGAVPKAQTKIEKGDLRKAVQRQRSIIEKVHHQESHSKRVAVPEANEQVSRLMAEIIAKTESKSTKRIANFAKGKLRREVNTLVGSYRMGMYEMIGVTAAFGQALDAQGPQLRTAVLGRLGLRFRRKNTYSLLFNYLWPAPVGNKRTRKTTQNRYYRYAAVCGEAAARGIAPGELAVWLFEHGGIEGLLKRKPKSKPELIPSERTRKKCSNCPANKVVSSDDGEGTPLLSPSGTPLRRSQSKDPKPVTALTDRTKPPRISGKFTNPDSGRVHRLRANKDVRRKMATESGMQLAMIVANASGNESKIVAMSRYPYPVEDDPEAILDHLIRLANS